MEIIMHLMPYTKIMSIVLLSFVALSLGAMQQEQVKAKTKADMEFEQACEELSTQHALNMNTQPLVQGNSYSEETLCDTQKRTGMDFSLVFKPAYVMGRNQLLARIAQEQSFNNSAGAPNPSDNAPAARESTQAELAVNRTSILGFLHMTNIAKIRAKAKLLAQYPLMNLPLIPANSSSIQS
jgi:hypothetical protein